MTNRLAVAFIVSLPITIQTPAPSLSDWSWLDASREAAFNQLMPLTARAGQILAYRSYRALHQDVPELYLRVDHGAPHSTDVFVATVIVPVGHSIQQQLLDLHRARPDATLESLLRDVMVKRTSVSSTQCPALTQNLDALSGLAVTIPDRNVIVLHPQTYRFIIDVGTVSMNVTLFDDDAPLVRWAATTIATVRRCAV